MFNCGRHTRPISRNLHGQQLRKLLRILFIDDNDMPIVTALREQGYNVFHKRDVIAISELENEEYHLIFCDISGIASHISPDEGAGLIDIIKSQIKHPVVIAYSAFNYQPGTEHSRAIREVADDEIKKDSPLEKYIKTIIKWGEEYFSTERCINLLIEGSDLTDRELKKLIRRSDAEHKLKENPKIKSALRSASHLKTVVEVLIVIIALAP